MPNPPPWSAVRISDYGYTRITIFNNTHLSLQQVSDDQVRLYDHPKSFQSILLLFFI